MNVDPSHNQPDLSQIQAHPRQAGVNARSGQPAGITSHEARGVDLQQSETATRTRALVERLMAEPEVRPEMLARGRELAGSQGYPTPGQLDQLAQALLSPIS